MMKAKFVRFSIIMLIGVCGFTSCNLDNDDENEIYALQFVTVENASSVDAQLRLDNGNLVTVELGETSSGTLTKNLRCLAYYRTSPTPQRLYSIQEVPTSTIEELTYAKKDSIGCDSTYYLNMFYVGADYLNVYFSSYSSKKNISLIFSPDRTSSQDTAYLELRYNANNSKNSTTSSAPMCFKLEQLRKEGADSTIIFVKTNSLVSTGKYETKEYEFRQVWKK